MAKRQEKAGDLVLAFEERCELSPDDVGIALPGQRALLLIPATVPLYHADYQRRHPLAAYNVSLTTVCQRGQAVCERLGKLVVPRAATPTSDYVDELLNAQDGFLDACMEHMEDCKHILECFRPKSGSRNCSASDTYHQAVQDYRDHIGSLVNHLKHQQGRLRYVQLSSGHMLVPGYWVEQVRADGSLVPHERFHRGGHTAFSFARDLRYHAASVTWVSIQLARAVESIANMARQVIEPSPDPTVLAFFQAVATLPGLVFADEVVDPWPLISAPRVRGRQKRTICVEYPSVSGHPLAFRQGRVTSVFKGDGVTRSFQVPYLGEEGWANAARKNPGGKGLF